MLELFPKDQTNFSPSIPDGEVNYFPSFLSTNEADILFAKLLATTPWQSDSITVYGKTYDQPRLTSLHAIDETPYSYSNITMQPNPMTPVLSAILKKIETYSKHSFNAVLLNLYRDGKDSNGWHADNEKELGKNPVIASISLGQERFFHLKHRTIKEERFKLKLAHGSLLLMSGSLQHHWLHQIPKTTRPLEPRINLTFRALQ
jgi:alkylated DNA repair dioxygenase AlkB